jgi:hypothetical protein
VLKTPNLSVDERECARVRLVEQWIWRGKHQQTEVAQASCETPRSRSAARRIFRETSVTPTPKRARIALKNLTAKYGIQASRVEKSFERSGKPGVFGTECSLGEAEFLKPKTESKIPRTGRRVQRTIGRSRGEPKLMDGSLEGSRGRNEASQRTGSRCRECVQSR